MSSENENNKLLAEILEIKEALRLLTNKIERMEVDLRNEMTLKHQAIDFKLMTHDNDISGQKKIVFFVAAALGTALIGALMKLVLRV